MQNNSTVSKFIQNNLIQIIIFIISFTIAWTLLGSRLKVVEVQSKENEDEIQKLTELVERIIVLEEHDDSRDRDIREIKEDIRKIKIFLNVPIK